MFFKIQGTKHAIARDGSNRRMFSAPAGAVLVTSDRVVDARDLLVRAPPLDNQSYYCIDIDSLAKFDEAYFGSVVFGRRRHASLQRMSKPHR